MGLSAAIAWYRRPLDVVGGFDIPGFDLTGVAPVAYGCSRSPSGLRQGACQRVEHLRPADQGDAAWVRLFTMGPTVTGLD